MNTQSASTVYLLLLPLVLPVLLASVIAIAAGVMEARGARNAAFPLLAWLWRAFALASFVAFIVCLGFPFLYQHPLFSMLCCLLACALLRFSRQAILTK